MDILRNNLIGVLVFLSGMAINIHSDGILTGLRKTSGGKTNGKSDYKIPRGGFFEVVSSANYFGEIVEWWGLFIATNGTPQVNNKLVPYLRFRNSTQR